MSARGEADAEPTSPRVRVGPPTDRGRSTRQGTAGYDVGTESVRNLALIALGRDDLVTYGEMGSFGDGAAGVLLGVQGDVVANVLGKDLR
jgi:hypothetical protein